MKNCWSFLLLAVVLQSLVLSILAGHHHGHGSNLAHILAAGLIVQLLSRQNGGGGGFGGRHSARHAGHHSDPYAPYGQGSWIEESRMSPESTLASSTWAQQAPLDLSYSHSMYKEPVMESYNMPYYNPPPYPQSVSSGIW